MSIQLLIADDHPIIRKALRQMLESDSAFAVVHEARDGRDALDAIERMTPDIAILDIDMPVLNGLEVLRELRQKSLRVDVVILTMYNDEELFNEAMDLGVKGYILKEGAVDDIRECAHAVSRGKYYISPSISEFLVHRSERYADLHKAFPALSQLSAAERRVLRLIGEGRTSKQIAGELSVSPKTVDNHRQNIAQKLGLHGAHALLKFALAHKAEL